MEVVLYALLFYFYYKIQKINSQDKATWLNAAALCLYLIYTVVGGTPSIL